MYVLLYTVYLLLHIQYTPRYTQYPYYKKCRRNRSKNVYIIFDKNNYNAPDDVIYDLS